MRDQNPKIEQKGGATYKMLNNASALKLRDQNPKIEQKGGATYCFKCQTIQKKNESG